MDTELYYRRRGSRVGERLEHLFRGSVPGSMSVCKDVQSKPLETIKAKMEHFPLCGTCRVTAQRELRSALNLLER